MKLAARTSPAVLLIVPLFLDILWPCFSLRTETHPHRFPQRTRFLRFGETNQFGESFDFGIIGCRIGVATLVESKKPTMPVAQLRAAPAMLAPSVLAAADAFDRGRKPVYRHSAKPGPYRHQPQRYAQ